MTKVIREHLGYYTSLFTILLIGGLLTLGVSDKSTKILSLYMTIFFYMVVGIVHHLKNHDLTSKLVVEYVLIGALVMVLVLLML